MGREEFQYMGQSLQMKVFKEDMLMQAFYQWQTVEEIQMQANFL